MAPTWAGPGLFERAGGFLNFVFNNFTVSNLFSFILLFFIPLFAGGQVEGRLLVVGALRQEGVRR